MSPKLETQEIFLSFLEDSLELSTGILKNNPDANLDDIDEWDSLSIMSFVSLLDVEFKIEIDADVLMNCKSPSELFSLTSELIK